MFYDSYAIEARFDGINWTNITADIVSDISGAFGIPDNGPLDRVAGVGEMTFTLNNSASNSAGIEGYYTPGGINCRTGFRTGLQVRLQMVYDNLVVTRFIGKIAPKGIDTAMPVGVKRTTVRVRDWYEQAANTELQGLEMLENKTMAEAIPSLLALMDHTPATVQYYDCESILPTVFDAARGKTFVYSELAKLALSELGFVSLGHQGLRVEGRFTRTEQQVRLLPLPTSSLYYAMSEDDYILQTEDEYNLLLPAGVYAEFPSMHRNLTTSYGRHLYNRITFTAYPRRIDTSDVMLFELQSPIELGVGETAIITGKYRDPDNPAVKVAGVDFVTPAAGTHYIMKDAASGGNVITSDLDVDYEFNISDWKYELTNNSGMTGWVTTLSVEGRGVYLYDSLSYTVEDATSIAENGMYPLSVDMKYQHDPAVAKGWANLTLEFYKDPKLQIDSVEYNANRSLLLLLAFLNLDPGDMIAVSDTAGFNDRYFVHKILFNIKRGGKVDFGYLLRNAGLDTYAFWELGVPGRSEIGTTTRLGA